MYKREKKAMSHDRSVVGADDGVFPYVLGTDGGNLDTAVFDECNLVFT